MKKTFPLSHPDHAPPRVIESIKNQIRKYVKRERGKKLPDDVDFWDFDCRVGSESATAKTAHITEIVPAVSTASSSDWKEIYVEILAKPGRRKKKTSPAKPETEPSPKTDEGTPSTNSPAP